MSRKLVARSPDLRRLRDDGLDLQIVGGTILLVKQIPYVTPAKQVKRGTLVSVPPLNQPLGAQSLNHLREFMRRAFKAAIGERLMPGPNPIDGVRRWVVPKRLPDFLRFHEVPLVLAAVRSKWRDLFATAIYAGLRKGELLGLSKTDVDLEIGVIMVRRSYDRVTTKGKRCDAIPVAAELRPYLDHALRVSPSDLVFPREDGSMYAENMQLEMVLRRALRKAGLVSGLMSLECRSPTCPTTTPSASRSSTP